MKKWLTGLLSRSSAAKKSEAKDLKEKKEPKDKTEKKEKKEKKTGKNEMPKAKPAAKAAKPAAKAVKTAAKAKSELKSKSPKSEAKPKPEALAKVSKTKVSPETEKPARPVDVAQAAKADKKPKKGADKENEASTTAVGVIDTSSPENKKKWREMREKFAKEKAPPYSMAAQFQAEQPIEHKVLGWGYVLTNNNDRLEVLFETGVKILISNYRS